MTEAQAIRGECASSGSDGTYDYTCQPCSEDNKNLEAVGFCVDCSEFLCDVCYNAHLRPRPCRHHKLINIDEAKNNPSLSGCLDVCTEKCPKHKGKIIEFFCVKHDCLGCGVCITLDHKTCEAVQYIPEVAQNTGSGAELTRLIRELDMISLQAKRISDSAKANALKSQVTFDKVLEHLRQLRKDVNASFDKLENKILTEGRKRKNGDENRMSKNVQNCHQIQVKAESLASRVKGLKDKRQYCNMFVAMKANRQDVDSLTQSLQDIGRTNSVSEYLFQPSEQLQHFIKFHEKLGNITSDENVILKVTRQTDINMRIQRDKNSCWISGIATISSSRLVAVDRNNKTAKLIDTNQCTVISDYPLPCHPWGATFTEEVGVVAVTLPDRQEVLLLRARDDKLIKHRVVRTNGLCYSVSSVKDKLVVSLTRPERLEIIDYDGHVMHRIKHDDNGQPVFTDVRSLTVNQAAGTIYVSDLDENTVTCISLAGKVVGVYKDNGLRGARGVTVDDKGNVYVCGRYSNNIHQLTPDCDKLSVLLSDKDGLSSPSSVCYEKITNCLYVGRFSDVILVYQMS